MTLMHRARHAFTIVELLVVIAIIAILAAITITTYNGIQRRANTSSADSTLNQVSKKLITYQSMNGIFPATLQAADVAGIDITNVQYTHTDTTFCLTVPAGAVTRSLQSGGAPKDGPCV